MLQGGNKSQKLAVLFEDWLEAEEKWSSSKLVLQYKSVKTTGKRGSRVWMIRSQIEEKYKSEKLANEIIESKEGLDEKSKALCVRDHPDLATPDPAWRQYLVFDAETEYDSEDTVLTSLMGVTLKSESKSSKKRKNDSSSSSDSSASESESTDSSSDKKKKKNKKASKNKKGKKDKETSKKNKKAKKESKEKKAEKEKKEKEREEAKKVQVVRSNAKKAGLFNACLSCIYQGNFIHLL